MTRSLFLIVACLTVPRSAALAETALPTFLSETVDAKVAIGYGIALEDVDGDGKKDILLADKKQFVWYQNPDWKRHVMVENLTEHDNVCIAARDVDGDGKVEVAVGAQWNPGDTVNSGSVHYLIAPEDRTKPWTPVKLHHEPVVHRMRWVRGKDDNYVLVVAPLHGRGNRAGMGDGVRLLAYQMPSDPRQEWKTDLLDDTLHVTHNFDRGQWQQTDGDGGGEEIAYLGREGAILITRNGKQLQKMVLQGIQGGGEIRMGRTADGTRFIATVEAFHGDQLVFYPFHSQATAGDASQHIARTRVVLDDNLKAGHAVATGDLLGRGGDQIVVGWRSPNRDGKVGIKLYYATDSEGNAWKSVWVDENAMACEDLRIADLDGDGRIDIVAAGRATHNLKVYWNRAKNN